MIALICFVLAVLASPFKSNIRLEAENAVLRHQLIVLQRKVRGRAHLTNNDRWFFVQMYRWCVGIGPACAVIGAGNRARGEGARKSTSGRWAWRICFGVRRASTANCSSLDLRSRNQRSPRTWLPAATRLVRTRQG